MTAGVALDPHKPVFEQAALQVVVELLLDEMRRGCAFGLQPGKKLRVAGLDDAIERRLFRSVAFVDVAVGTAGSKQSSQPASAWVDKAGRRRTTCLSAWAVPGWRRRARFDVGIFFRRRTLRRMPSWPQQVGSSRRRCLACRIRTAPSALTLRPTGPMDQTTICCSGRSRSGRVFHLPSKKRDLCIEPSSRGVSRGLAGSRGVSRGLAGYSRATPS